jgi:alanine dehydrogenase
MIVGTPKEIKDGEQRVALTPWGVAALAKAGHTVLVESAAGQGSGFADGEYQAAGAQIVPDPSQVWAAELVVKVKEPLPSEYGHLREGQILFTFLHLAAEPELTRALLDRRVTAIAYETVRLPDGALPLLAPMSEVAGRMAPQVAAHYLQHTEGGRGKLLGGVAGVAPGHVVILGAGTVGTNAARVALGMGALVTLADINLERLRYLDLVMHGRLVTMASGPSMIEEAVRTADAVIGAVLVPGDRAPVLVTKDTVASMAPGAVIVDVAVDQGGCIATSRMTSHSAPTYIEHRVVHYGVPNMPGAVPRTSTMALCSATLPYVRLLADLGIAAVRSNAALAQGVNTYAGMITHPSVAAALDQDVAPLEALLREAAPGTG